MDYNLLLRSPLFHDFSGSEIESIFDGIPFQVKKIRSGALVAQSGEPVTALLIVVKGVVKGEMIDFAGRVIKIEDIPAPGALASAFLFGTRNRFPVNVLAVSDTEVLRIEKPDFLKLLKEHDKLLVNFLNMISNRSQFLSEKIKFLNFKTIKEKLAQYILANAGPGNSSLTMKMTQADLADYFGVARPSLARAVAELEEEKLISARNKVIQIISREGLASLTRN